MDIDGSTLRELVLAHRNNLSSVRVDSGGNL